MDSCKHAVARYKLSLCALADIALVILAKSLGALPSKSCTHVNCHETHSNDDCTCNNTFSVGILADHTCIDAFQKTRQNACSEGKIN